MKKIALTIAAAATLLAVVPASAETIVIRNGHRDHGWHHRDRAWHSRAEWRHERWHRARRPAVVITR